MAREIVLSRCPRCGARGVKLFEPLIVDGFPRDVPYCGICGRNYPEPPVRPDHVTSFERGER